MALYRNISLSFWTDSKVDDDFTPEDKYFYLYLLTNPHTNICGCYEIGMKQMCRETGYNEDTILRLLKRMETVHGVIRYSANTKEVLIPNWGRYNWSNPKVKVSVKSAAKDIKNPNFRQFIEIAVSENTLSTECRYPMDSLCIGYGYPIQTTDTDTDTDCYADTDTDTATAKKTRFQKPTVEEVKEYCMERGNGIDAQQFVDFYESKGWKIGKDNMRDWKAAVRTWERRDTQRGNSKGAELNAFYDRAMRWANE